MKWIKKGNIFNPAEWMVSYAQCPNAIELGNRIRVYFSKRLSNQQSLPIYIDIEKENLSNILEINKEPILERGRKGTFDENGIIPNYLIEIDNKIYFYYAGWSQCRNVPYKNFTGLAISEDKGNSFKKYAEGPVFGMNSFDALSATGPWITHKDGKYFAIYSTGTNWHNIEGHLEHTYAFTYATSDNAIDWQPSKKFIVEPNNEFEAHCKPTIIKIDNTYHMWFSRRGSHDFRTPGSTSYRIGYAYSKDLINWTRDDSKAGIDVSESGWDSEMICYPNIIKVNKKYIMFYNGNGFGKEGFGYAELEI